jgi:hypothetical protein
VADIHVKIAGGKRIADVDTKHNGFFSIPDGVLDGLIVFENARRIARREQAQAHYSPKYD